MLEVKIIKPSLLTVCYVEKNFGLISYRNISFYGAYIITALGKTMLGALKNMKIGPTKYTKSGRKIIYEKKDVKNVS